MRFFYCAKCCIMQKQDKTCEKCQHAEMREIIILNEHNRRNSQYIPELKSE